MKHFKDIMKTVLIDRALDFKGRSARPEYWFFNLYCVLVMLLLMVVDHFLIGYTFWNWLDPWSETTNTGILGTAFLILTLVQSISVCFRRIQDRGHSGWWFLAIFVPVLNFVPLYWCLRSAKDTPEALSYENPYGKE